MANEFFRSFGPDVGISITPGANGRLEIYLDGEKIFLEEQHRFSNGPVKMGDALHWDIERLFDELKTGLKKAAARKLPIASISTPPHPTFIAWAVSRTESVRAQQPVPGIIRAGSSPADARTKSISI